MDRQLRVWWACFFLNVRNSACPSDQSWRGHFITTQDHHPPSKRGRWLGAGVLGAASERRPVNSLQHIFIEHQVYAKLNPGDPELQGAVWWERHTMLL